MAARLKSLLPKLAFSLLFLGVLAGAIWWLRPAPPHPIEQLRADARAARQQQGEADTLAALGGTVARAWRWDNFSDDDVKAVKEAAAQPESFPFDVVVIYDALGDVQLDESGNVVMDDAALQALDNSLGSLIGDLSPAALDQLQELIRIGLPGAAGRQTAAVVGDYYRFRMAEQEFIASTPEPATPAELANYHERLSVLRDSYIGADVAAKLYGERDAMLEYTLATMRIQQDDSLSAEAKSEQVASLRESLPAGLLGEEVEAESPFGSEAERQRWERRYAVFARERQQILNAGLTVAEADAQIEALLRQHFDGGEIELARTYQPSGPEEESDEASR